MCVGCRTRRQPTDLVRFSRRDGRLVVNATDGRGAWLCAAGPDVPDVATAPMVGVSLVMRSGDEPDEPRPVRLEAVAGDGAASVNGTCFSLAKRRQAFSRALRATVSSDEVDDLVL